MTEQSERLKTLIEQTHYFSSIHASEQAFFLISSRLLFISLLFPLIFSLHVAFFDWKHCSYNKNSLRHSFRYSKRSSFISPIVWLDINCSTFVVLSFFFITYYRFVVFTIQTLTSSWTLSRYLLYLHKTDSGLFVNNIFCSIFVKLLQ